MENKNSLTDVVSTMNAIHQIYPTTKLRVVCYIKRMALIIFLSEPFDGTPSMLPRFSNGGCYRGNSSIYFDENMMNKTNILL